MQQAGTLLDDRFEVVRELSTRKLLVRDREHPDLEPRVLRLLAPEEDPYDVELRREVEATQVVKHPQIARVHAVDSLSDGRAYYLQDYVEGVDLYRWALGKPPDVVLEVFGQLFRILAAYHAHGLIPGGSRQLQLKVQEEEGGPPVLRLIDQGGLQHEYARSPVSTTRGVAPERSAGLRVDRRANLYEAGLVLYELLSGSGEIQVSLVRQETGSTPPPLTQLAPGLPVDLATFVMVLLRRHPDDRPPSVRQALVTLEAISGQRLGSGDYPDSHLPLPPPCVGRASEIETLVDWAAALEDTGTAPIGTRAHSRRKVVDSGPTPVLGIVAGDPGSGRRRLIDELTLRLAQETLVLRGSCGAGGQGPFGPFGDMFRRLIVDPGVALFSEVPERARWVLRALLPDLARALPTGITPPPVDDTSLRSLRRLSAVAEHLLSVARERPVAILLDDLDRARPETLALVLHMARRTLSERRHAGTHKGKPPATPALLILATSRASVDDELTSDPSVKTLTVEPLAAQDLEFLATAALGEEGCTADLRQALETHAQGSPALAMRMVRRHVAGRLELDPPGSEQVGYLDQVAASVLTQGPEVRDAVVALGLLGRPARPEFLCSLTGKDDQQIGPAIVALCRDEVLMRDSSGAVALAHPDLAKRLAPRLPQESSRLLAKLPAALGAQLGEVTWRTRIDRAVEVVEFASLGADTDLLKRLGGLAAAFLESLGSYQRAANVCASLARAKPKEEFLWIRREAENRLNGGDPRRAEEILFRLTAGGGATQGDLAELWGTLIRSLTGQGKDGEAAEAIRQAHEDLGDREDTRLGRARLADMAASLHVAASEREEAAAHIKLGLDLLKGLKGPEINRVRAQLIGHDGQLAMLADDFDSAAQLLRASLAIQEREGLREDVAVTLQRLGHAAFAGGDLRRAEEHWRASLERLEGLGDRRGVGMVRSSIGLLEVRRGSLLAAREQLQQSLAIREELGDRRGRAAALHNLGYVYSCAGAMEEAADAYRESLELRLEDDDDEWYAASASNNLGEVLVQLGRTEEAYQLLTAALESRQGLGDRRGEAESLANLGMIDLRRGDLSLSMERVEASAQIREELGAPEDRADALRRRARCLYSLGDLANARTLARRAVRLTEDNRLTVLDGPCRLLLGAVMARQGRAKVARRELERARRAAEQLGDRLTARTATIELAALRLASGNPAEARALLDSRPVPRPGRLRPLEGQRPPDRYGVLRVRERLLRARIELSLETGSVSTAARCAEQAVAEARRAQLRDLEWRAVQALAATAEVRGQHEQALTLTVEAQELIEALLERVPAANLEDYLSADPLRAAALRGDSPVSVLEVKAVAPSEEAGTPLLQTDGLLHAMVASTVPTIQPARSGSGRRPKVQADAEAAPAEISDGFRTLVRLNRLIVDEPNVTRVQEALVTAAVTLTGAERGFLALFGDSHDDAFVLAAAGIDDVEAPSQRFFRHCAFKASATGLLVLSAEARVEPETKQRAHVVGLGLRSVLAAPVVSPDGRRGALYVDHTFTVGCFGSRDVELIEALADLCAMSVGRGALESALHHKQGVSPGLPQRQFLAVRASLEKPAPVTFGRPGGGLVGRSKSLRSAVESLERSAPLTVSVLIEGPAGVGKGVAARALHDKSGRRKLTVCDLRELPAAQIESELFGHVKGAFKGAGSARKGLLTNADRGTLLLEHLDDVPVEIQAKLVRALEERTVRPLGAEKDVPFDVRVIATVKPGIADRVRDGTFRDDLFVLVSKVHVEFDALDQRPEDKGPLIDAFLGSLRAETPPSLTPEARAALENRRYPGDARELNAVIVAAASLAGEDPIGLEDLPPVRSREPVALRDALKEFESQTIKRSLIANRNDLTKAAKELGISRRALKRKLTQFELEEGS